HTIMVTTQADEDNGNPFQGVGSGTSLREAINWANANPGADTIAFAVGGTITLGGGQLPAFTDTATTTVSGWGTPDAHSASRIFQVNFGAGVGLTRLTLANGKTSGVAGGGGILNSGRLSLTGCTLTRNSASSDGGGIENHGALALTNCTLYGNSASHDG